MTRDEKWLLDEKYGGVRSTQFEADRHRLATGEPLAYVIGWIPFSGLRIHLDAHPLIPRPETEWWTEELAKALIARYGSNPCRILDLCAGSGAIGCALMKALPEARVAFGELNRAYEPMIRKNIETNGLDLSRASIRIGDLFVPFENEKFDIIATNPPYVPQHRELPESVEKYEPTEALRAGEDGLSLIRRIAIEAPEHMNPGGELWLECDSEHALEAARLMLLGGAKESAIRTDPYGRERLIVSYF